MNVSLNNGVFTIKTGVTAAQAEKAYGKPMKARDEKGNDLYALSKGTTPSLSTFGITTNQVIDGELAYVIVVAEGTTQEDLLKAAGDSLIAAKKYLPVIAANIESYASELASVFTE